MSQEIDHHHQGISHYLRFFLSQSNQCKKNGFIQNPEKTTNIKTRVACEQGTAKHESRREGSDATQLRHRYSLGSLSSVLRTTV